MAGENPLQDPLAHSIDNDAFHFPGDFHFDVYHWTGQFFPEGGIFGIHGLTKFMFLELVAAVLCLLVFVPLGWNVRRNGYAKGITANLLESILFFIRDKVAVPAIGEHDSNKFLPFLWSVFFFILFNNLLGMIPWMGSPTGALGCTMALALCSLVMIHGSAMVKLGVPGYAKAFVPHVPMALYPLMLVVELVGNLIKPVILALRLFVNMLAGHTVLFVIMAFISMVGFGFLYFIVTPASVMGVIALSMLELFVAFLQAYVFTFLTAIFIGAAIHPHH
jgi:F-type H+-transporting ATPase subunit a